MMELTGQGRSFVAPLLLGVVIATLVANVRAYAGPISPAGRLISTGERRGDGP
jgi:hypothetical protein